MHALTVAPALAAGVFSPAIEAVNISKGEYQEAHTHVLNGIACDAAVHSPFVTEEPWPKLSDLKLVKKTGAQ